VTSPLKRPGYLSYIDHHGQPRQLTPEQATYLHITEMAGQFESGWHELHSTRIVRTLAERGLITYEPTSHRSWRVTGITELGEQVLSRWRERHGQHISQYYDQLYEPQNSPASDGKQVSLDAISDAHAAERAAETALIRAVVAARSTGATWAEIGDRVGISESNALRRFRPYLEEIRLVRLRGEEQ
jgi:hypothetical protein